MLEVTLTKKIAGVEIWRDSYSLRAAHEMIHRVNQDSPVIQNKEGFLLDWPMTCAKPTRPTATATAVAWRGQGALLDLWSADSLAGADPASRAPARSHCVIPTTRRDQAIVYELEALIEEAVRSALPGQEA